MLDEDRAGALRRLAGGERRAEGGVLDVVVRTEAGDVRQADRRDRAVELPEQVARDRVLEAPHLLVDAADRVAQLIVEDLADLTLGRVDHRPDQGLRAAGEEPRQVRDQVRQVEALQEVAGDAGVRAVEEGRGIDLGRVDQRDLALHRRVGRLADEAVRTGRTRLGPGRQGAGDGKAGHEDGAGQHRADPVRRRDQNAGHCPPSMYLAQRNFTYRRGVILR
ncbi:protein of unknown function (plasmid) [Methylorubrum extorquens DM4]|uniref:Uncharacterized protein n=1 Tax=Methylorubrum extorquens (strain DSM 6343 / CIP 106787 / DM4) TaxID=661410 RepID=A0A2P9HBP6_METED|nr:protein of unknown function [Methylorubrum extorquens DM4]